MYRIVFAEDEALIRNSIIKVINWDRYGFEIAAEARDGEEALAAVTQFHPDVLITDIKMPFMDGIELSKQAKKLNPAIKIVIISGYTEFRYAQEAISIGVEEYLLKPITPVKLEKLLTKMYDQFEAEKADRQRLQNLVADLREAEDRLKTEDDIELRGDDLLEITDFEKMVALFLRSAELEDIDDFIDTVLTDETVKKLDAVKGYKKHFLLRILNAGIQYVEALGGDSASILPDTCELSSFINNTIGLNATRRTLKNLFESVINYRHIASKANSAEMEKAKLVIAEHYADPDFSIKDAAAEIGLSSNYFGCVFKEYTGVSFVRYLTQLRLETAKELIKTTHDSIALIAEKVGYPNTNYFSSLFKKYFDMTPNDFRNQ